MNALIQAIKKQDTWMVGVFLFLLIFITYGETIFHGFVWDDQYFMEYDRRIRDLNLKQFFTSYFFQGKYYRPLVLLSFALNWKFAGANPFWFHFGNVLLHWFTTLLLYFFLKRILRNETASFIGAAIFAVHPVHVEAIALISARGDLFAAFFCLTSFLSYIKYKQNYTNNMPWFFVALLCYAGGLFSKEMALTLPAALFIYDRLYRNRSSIVRDYIPFLFIAILYLTLRTYALGAFGGVSNGNISQLYLIPYIALTYARLFVVPVSLHAIYSLKIPSGIFDFGFISSLLSMAAFCLLIFYIGKSRIPVMFGFLFVCITLSPVLNFIPIQPPLAERFAYLPSIGVALIAGYIYKILHEWLSRRRLERGASFIFLIIVVSFGILSLQRNSVWKDNIALWESVIRQYPDILPVKMNLALSYFDAGQYQKSIPVYEEILKQDSTNSSVLRNLGISYYHVGNNAEAINIFQKLMSHSSMPEYYSLLAKSFIAQGDTAKAVEYFQKSIQLFSHEWEPYALLSSILGKQGKIDAAIALIHKAENFNTNPVLLLELGNNYLRKRMLDSAVAMWEEAVKIDTTYEPAYRNLASAALDLKNYSKAEDYWRKITVIDPEVADIYWNWALMKRATGNNDSALIIAQHGYNCSKDSIVRRQYELLIKDIKSNP